MPLLTAEASYALMKKYNVPTVKYGIARSFREVELIAHNTDYPLVLKIDAVKIVHKTDVGCVKIVYSHEDLQASYKALMSNATKITKEINGVLVQEFLRGLEAITGSVIDEQFGKTIMFGSGGVLIQVFKDVTFRLVPVSREDAESMIDDTKISQLLNYRGNKVDKNKIIDVLLKINHLVQNENIQEMDINPLFLTEKGAFAADVRIIR